MCARLLWNGIGQHVEYGCILVGYVGLVWSCIVVCGVLRGLDKKRGKDQYVGNIYIYIYI